MSSNITKKFHTISNLVKILIPLGVFTWIVANVYFLPFSIWTAGITRPWFITNGYVPYRDFVWLRMPLDLFFLSGWYGIFGPTPAAYQNFVFVLLLCIAISLFFLSRSLIYRFSSSAFIFFAVFLFPLFQNTEEDEMLIGFWAILLLAFMSLFLKKQKVIYLLFAGIIAGMSLVTKQTSGLLIIASLAGIIFNFFLRKDAIKSLLTRIGVFGLGVLIPVSIILSYFVSKNSVEDFLRYTVFFNFSSVVSNLPKGDGFWIIAGYLCLLFPFVLFWKNTKLIPQIVFFITLEILCLFVSLFPSALSYKAFTSYTLISIVAGCDILLLFSLKKHKKIVLLSFALFLVFVWGFVRSYFSGNPGFAPNQLIQDFGTVEYEIASLVRSNTNKNDKIMNYGSGIIYLLADRLPQNKYVDPFPYMLQPYNASLKALAINPPKIVVYDESLPADHPGLSDWPGLQFIRDNYRIIGRYSAIVVYDYIQK